MVQHHLPSTVDNGKALRLRQGMLQRHQGAGDEPAVAGVFCITFQNAKRYIAFLSVEIPDNHDQPVHLRIE